MKKANTFLPIGFLLLSMLPYLLMAKDTDSLKIQTLNDKSYITVNLLTSINTFNPRWRVGYIKSIDPNWKVGLDIGFGNRDLSYTYFAGKFEEDYKLWEVRPELYYILNPKKKTLKYVSTELFYIHHEDIYHNAIIMPKNGGFFSYDKASYQRQKYGLHVKSGLFINALKRIGLNIYTGLGFRFRDNSFTDVINLEPGEEWRDMFVLDYNEIEGLNFDFDFSLGFKLYYKLNS